jgi:hypothetical protein
MSEYFHLIDEVFCFYQQSAFFSESLAIKVVFGVGAF